MIKWKKTPEAQQTEVQDLDIPSSDHTSIDTNIDLPIALHNGKRGHTTHHPIRNFISCHHLFPTYHAFVSRLSVKNTLTCEREMEGSYKR